MPRSIGRMRRAALIRDILEAKHDLASLAQAHRLKPDELAAWVDDPQNQRVLNGLCKLADVQTQVLLSRYRMLAATRLIKLATDADLTEGKPDVARRACVDLLRLDLKRAEVESPDDAAQHDELHDEFDRLQRRLCEQDAGS